ncbi:hypothetical protein PIB30_086362 [Stylosanthes scabra]|uniref:Uncharacterized protein n=1 Tax=Stylosanthes scabra TaxID=79078 RepID=A0ABU6YQN3_9FABA|nr:hypothetical protein [Stylosanthes scabra]
MVLGCSHAGVTILGTVPSIVKTWNNMQYMKDLDWTKIKTFCSTSETSNVDDDLWLSLKSDYKPVIEIGGDPELAYDDGEVDAVWGEEEHDVALAVADAEFKNGGGNTVDGSPGLVEGEVAAGGGIDEGDPAIVGL